jgi:transcriptional regulator with XRE-family HTH domain
MSETLRSVTFLGNRLGVGKVTGRAVALVTIRRMRDWQNTEFHERLAWARARAGHKRPTDAARALDEKPGTYRTWERGRDQDGRVPELDRLQKVARKFKVSWSWLLSGTGQPDDQAESELRSLADRFLDQLGTVPEEKRADALNAIEGVLSAFARKAG